MSWGLERCGGQEEAERVLNTGLVDIKRGMPSFEEERKWGKQPRAMAPRTVGRAIGDPKSRG